MNRFHLLACIAAVACAAHVPAAPIAPRLLENANSIVNLDRTEVVCSSLTSSTEKRVRDITVLSDKDDGAKHGNFVLTCDEFSSLSKFRGIVTDTLGKLIKKISKSDLQVTEYSPELASGSVTYYYECFAPSFPYRVRYEWEISISKGIIGFSPLNPQHHHNQAVADAEYSLVVPHDMGCHFKEINAKGCTTSTTDEKGNTVMKAAMHNIPAIPREKYGYDLDLLTPMVLFAPDHFSFDGFKGDMDSWQDFGKWLSGLIDFNAPLPDDFRTRLHAITDSCKTPREKVAKIYNLLRTDTRYVSIQLGIGGFRPIDAVKTCKLRFGDCKGLSHFMYAMLHEVGIPAVYTVISTDRKDFYHDFTSIGQQNHAIVQIPLPSDTLWIECTAPQLPLGYVHSSIAGHEALLVKPGMGIITRLPQYADEETFHNVTYDIAITPNFAATMHVSERESLGNYEQSEDFADKSLNDQKGILLRNSNVPQGEVTAVTVVKEKSARPVLLTSYTITTPQFGKKTGIRIFVPVNPLRSGSHHYECNPRFTPFDFDGEMWRDTINITLPAGMIVEAAPHSLMKSSDFGSISTLCSIKDNKISITQQFFLRRGKFPASKNEDFTKFYNEAVDMFNTQIVLRKLQ